MLVVGQTLVPYPCELIPLTTSYPLENQYTLTRDLRVTAGPPNTSKPLNDIVQIYYTTQQQANSSPLILPGANSIKVPAFRSLDVVAS